MCNPKNYSDRKQKRMKPRAAKAIKEETPQLVKFLVRNKVKPKVVKALMRKKEVKKFLKTLDKLAKLLNKLEMTKLKVY